MPTTINAAPLRDPQTPLLPAAASGACAAPINAGAMDSHGGTQDESSLTPPAVASAPFASATDWLLSPHVTAKLAEFREQDRLEALAKLRAYKSVSCTAEKWDRMLGLLELCRDRLDAAEDGELVREINRMLEDR